MQSATAMVSAAGVEYPKGTSSRFTLRRPFAFGGDSDETRFQGRKRPPHRGGLLWCRRRGSNPHSVATGGF